MAELTAPTHPPQFPEALGPVNCYVIARAEDGTYWSWPYRRGKLSGPPQYLGETRADANRARLEMQAACPVYVEDAP